LPCYNLECKRSWWIGKRTMWLLPMQLDRT
jgi:hypothetical protein